MGCLEVRFIKDECFQDYKLPCMLIGTCWCDWKCFTGCEENLCQNIGLTESEILCFDIEDKNNDLLETGFNLEVDLLEYSAELKMIILNAIKEKFFG